MPVAPAYSFPIEIDVDLDFQPASYVADWCPTAAIIQNITGEARRQCVYERLSGGERAGFDDAFLADHLEPWRRVAAVASDPFWRGSGEYLPPYAAGEVEIVRFVIATLPRVVYSVRAARGPRTHLRRVREPATRRYRYRVVDEQGTAFTLPRSTSTAPLSLRELIRLIDGIRIDSIPAELQPSHIPLPYALTLWRSTTNVDDAELRSFVRIYSAVYPELAEFYRRRLAWFVDRRLASRQ